MALNGIDAVVKAVNKLGADILLISTPLNSTSRAYYKNIDHELWSKIDSFSKQNHVRFIDLNNEGQLEDTLYSDFVHMNENRARCVAKRLLNIIRAREYQNPTAPIENCQKELARQILRSN